MAVVPFAQLKYLTAVGCSSSADNSDAKKGEIEISNITTSVGKGKRQNSALRGRKMLRLSNKMNI